jgi:hypothetical protein
MEIWKDLVMWFEGIGTQMTQMPMATQIFADFSFGNLLGINFNT